MTSCTSRLPLSPYHISYIISYHIDDVMRQPPPLSPYHIIYHIDDVMHQPPPPLSVSYHISYHIISMTSCTSRLPSLRIISYHVISYHIDDVMH